VPFTLLDVCVGSGLRVGGVDVQLENETVDSYCRSLFRCGILKVKMGFDELVKCQSDGRVKDFCKLYIVRVI